MDDTETVKCSRICLKALRDKVDITTDLYKMLIDSDGKMNEEMKQSLNEVSDYLNVIAKMNMASPDGTNVINLVIKSFDALRNGNYSNVGGNTTVMIGSGRVVINVAYHITILGISIIFKKATIDNLNRSSSFADLKQCLVLNKMSHQSIKFLRGGHMTTPNSIDDGDYIACILTREQYYHVKFEIEPYTMTKRAYNVSI